MVGSAIHIVQRLANLLLIYEAQRKSSTFFNERDEIGRDFDVQVFYSLICLHFMVQLEALLYQARLLHFLGIVHRINKAVLGPICFSMSAKQDVFLHIEHWINKTKTR